MIFNDKAKIYFGMTKDATSQDTTITRVGRFLGNTAKQGLTYSHQKNWKRLIAGVQLLEAFYSITAQVFPLLVWRI